MVWIDFLVHHYNINVDSLKFLKLIEFAKGLESAKTEFVASKEPSEVRLAGALGTKVRQMMLNRISFLSLEL